MDTLTPQTSILEALDSQSDEALADLIDQARIILATRESERKKGAVAEIKRIAKAHGLYVAVKKQDRRRGRPPKNDGGLP